MPNDFSPVLCIGVERVGIVPQTRNLDTLIAELPNNFSALIRRKAIYVDVAGSRIAPLFAT
jgi:hypothetical protein